MPHTRFSATTSHQPTAATHDGAHQAFVLLRTVFTIAPIAFGLDKFLNLLTDWEDYLAPWVNDIVPGTAHQAMLAVGVVEIVAGVLGRREAGNRRLRGRRVAVRHHRQPGDHG